MAEDFDPKELRRLAEAFPERPLPANERELEARDAFCDYVIRHKSVVLSLIGSEDQEELRRLALHIRDCCTDNKVDDTLTEAILRGLQSWPAASISLAPGEVGERIDALRKWSASLFKEERVLESQAVTETANMLEGLNAARKALEKACNDRIGQLLTDLSAAREAVEEMRGRILKLHDRYMPAISNLKEALRAQIAVSVRFARAAGFDDATISDCTAQAERALKSAESPEPQNKESSS